MPELPEVEVITAQAQRALGKHLTRIELLRSSRGYFDRASPGTIYEYRGHRVVFTRVFRRGKNVVLVCPYSICGDANYLIIHNAMTGYLDWEHDPWTFDYVEGARSPGTDDVRARFHFEDGTVMRFHDLRLFGRLTFENTDERSVLQNIGPELMRTPLQDRSAPIITLPQFAEWILRERRPVKEALMDQSRLAGIGNIYATEACHLAGIDPECPGWQVRPELVPVLLESLRCVVVPSMEQVTYTNLRAYRRSSCETCGGPIERIEIAKRASFRCVRCQWR